MHMPFHYRLIFLSTMSCTAVATLLVLLCLVHGVQGQHTTSHSTTTTSTITTGSGASNSTTTTSTITTESGAADTTPGCCVDQAGWSNCTQYILSSCHGFYYAYASSHCQAYCGLCRPCPIEPCVDAVDCERYGPEICTQASYRVWAYANCIKHCGFCDNYGFYSELRATHTPAGNTTVTTTTSSTTNRAHHLTSTPIAAPDHSTLVPSSASPTATPDSTTVVHTPHPHTSSTAATPGAACEDKISHCSEYSKESCEAYRTFMQDHCARYCGFCPGLQPVCQDALPSCAQYGQETCAEYEDFRLVQCRAFCHSC